MALPNLETIQNEVIKILEGLTSDWDLDDFSGAISGETQLVADLAFESIEIVQLIVGIEQHFGMKNLATEKLLMKDGRYVPDLSVSDIAGFLHGESAPS